MGSIHGSIFIVIGAGMASIVFFLAQELWAFYYVAGAFAAYGVIKLLFNAIKNSGKKSQHNNNHAQQRHPQHYTQHPQTHQNQQQQHNAHNPSQNHQQLQQRQHAQAQHQPPQQKYLQHHGQHINKFKYCGHCGQQLRIHDNFCPNCGARQR